MSNEDMRVALTASLRHIAGESPSIKEKLDEQTNEVTSPNKYRIVEGQTDLARYISCRDWTSTMSLLSGDDNKSFEESVTWMKIQHDYVQENFSNCTMLPVHLACLLQAPYNIIDLLTSQVHKVIPPTDPDSDTLVHIVAMYSPKLFKSLDIAVDDVLVQNSKGATPLHNACNARSWAPIKHELSVEPIAAVIDSILSMNDSLAAIPDNDGNIPLHILMANCRSNLLPNLEILYTLLTAYPGSAKVKNGNGETALHIFHKHEHKCSLSLAIDQRRNITEALLRDGTFYYNHTSSLYYKTLIYICYELKRAIG